MGSKKLQNIKAVQQLVDGNHKMQTRTTIGFHDIASQQEKNKVREVGEIWEEIDATGKTVCWWEQKSWGRCRSTLHPDTAKEMREMRKMVESFSACPKETCTCIKPSRIDELFRKKTGMCEDCIISMETKLKIQGKFNDYAKGKMRNNAEEFFTDADKEVDKLKDDLTKPITFLEDKFGNVETWKSTNSNALIEQIDNQYNTLKEKVREKLQ